MIVRVGLSFESCLVVIFCESNTSNLFTCFVSNKSILELCTLILSTIGIRAGRSGTDSAGASLSREEFVSTSLHF